MGRNMRHVYFSTPVRDISHLLWLMFRFLSICSVGETKKKIQKSNKRVETVSIRRAALPTAVDVLSTAANLPIRRNGPLFLSSLELVILLFFYDPKFSSVGFSL